MQTLYQATKSYDNIARERNPVAYALSRSGINLPSALSLERDDVRAICREVKAVLAMDHTNT